jgi:hypothetical protein
MTAIETGVMRALNRNELPSPIQDPISVKPRVGNSWFSSMSDLWRKPYAKRTLMLWAV